MLAQDFTTTSSNNVQSNIVQLNIVPAQNAVAANKSRTAPLIFIDDERFDEVESREALLDVVMGPTRKSKSSEIIRNNRLPAKWLNLVARDDKGVVIGTIRLWHIRMANMDGGFTRALLLGPLAVNQPYAGQGIGTALMKEAISRAAALGHGAILLVGDADYYCRFGFSVRKAINLAMPGLFEPHRFQALELIDGWLDNAYGMIAPSGKKTSIASLYKRWRKPISIAARRPIRLLGAYSCLVQLGASCEWLGLVSVILSFRKQVFCFFRFTVFIRCFSA